MSDDIGNNGSERPGGSLLHYTRGPEKKLVGLHLEIVRYYRKDHGRRKNNYLFGNCVGKTKPLRSFLAEREARRTFRSLPDTLRPTED